MIRQINLYTKALVETFVLFIVTFCRLAYDLFVAGPVHRAYRQGACGANTIAAALQQDLILDSALIAFKEILMPLAMFSTAFYDLPLQGTDTIQVPYYPLETAASHDFNGTYLFPDGTNTQSKPVVINKRKYQPLSFTSAELRRQPHFDPELLGMLKGRKLAEDILQDIMSLVTVANYGAAVFTGAASALTVDDIIDLGAVVQGLKWPQTGRGMILGPTYVAGIQKDMVANKGFSTFEKDPAGTIVNFPSLAGFSIASTNIIPGNAINLIGMIVYRSAILVGFSPIAPTPNVAQRLARYEIVTDPDTSLSLEYREWGDADEDTDKRIIECNYGYGLGELAALRPMVSA